MPRVVPRFDYTCYICGTSFTIVNNVDFDPTDPASFEPLKKRIECPCCTAPEKYQGQLTVGNALGLVLAHYGDSYIANTTATPRHFWSRLS